jgi:hypothetical protein
MSVRLNHEAGQMRERERYIQQKLIAISSFHLVQSGEMRGDEVVARDGASDARLWQETPPPRERPSSTSLSLPPILTTYILLAQLAPE